MDKSGPKRLKLTKMGGLLILGWTLFLALLLTWNLVQIKKSVEKEALTVLRMTVDRDLAFRAWATKHGGVYVPVGPAAEPNPYLAHIKDRDVTTTEAGQLTLFNPAYIMRQIYADDFATGGIYGRLTSLQPLNPINSPDAWETAALRMFAEQEKSEDYSEITLFMGEPSIRLIRPFYVEEGCLKCHYEQGYQPGDVVGGISTSRPLSPYLAVARSRQISLLGGYGVIWLVGLAGIGAFIRRVKLTTKGLEENEIRQRAMVEAIPDMLFRYSSEGTYLDAEIKDYSHFRQLLEKRGERGGIIGRRITDILPQETAARLLAAIEKVVNTGRMEVLEHQYTLDGQDHRFEERLVLESDGDKEVVSIVRDITAQKELEEKLRRLSFRDGLTGLYNRHYFQNELARLNKSGEYPISVIYADINGLKQINDNLGHSTGDLVLQACADILKKSLREQDILARVGGDEFVALLPKTDKDEADKIVARIRHNVADYLKKDDSLPLGLAVGAAATKQAGEDLQDIYKRADREMYKRKPTEPRL